MLMKKGYRGRGRLVKCFLTGCGKRPIYGFAQPEAGKPHPSLFKRKD